MSVTYSAAIKNTRMQAVLTAIDANASPAFIEIGTAGMGAVLVTVTLADPSFTLAGAILTMAGAPKSGTATGAGTAAEARIKDGGGTICASGLTVGTSGTDFIVSSVGIAVNDIFQINSGTLTHG
jgi:hypothetical protein